MKNMKLKVTIFLIIAIMLTVTVYPVSAVDYNPGVSAGQYVKYGNIVTIQDGVDTNTINWLLSEVISVSGKEVTERTSGQLKNGSAISGSGRIYVHNVENGSAISANETYETPGFYTYALIIAANLSEGDLIPIYSAFTSPISPGFIINKTATKTYLGVSRSVNIVNYTTVSDSNWVNRMTIFFDRISGVMLEFQIVYTSTIMNVTYSYSVVETNIFTAIEQPFYFQWWFIIGLIVIAAVVIAIVALAMRRR